MAVVPSFQEIQRRVLLGVRYEITRQTAELEALLHKMNQKATQAVPSVKQSKDFSKKRYASVGRKMRVTLSEEEKRKKFQKDMRDMQQLLGDSVRGDSLFYESANKQKQAKGESLNSSVVRWHDNSVQKVNHEWQHLFTISSASQHFAADKSLKGKAVNKLAGLER